MKRIFRFLVVVLMVSSLAGCNSSKRITYFQDVTNESLVSLIGDGQIRIKPHDRLTVVVTSKDAELAAPFNSASSYNSLSTNPIGMSSSNGVQSLQIRTVDDKGMLYMPIIGDVYCVGKTRAELADEIANKIKTGGYISDATVNIQFADMKIYVMGEVARPGQFDITRDRITILEALAMAGDMTIYGNRANVTVIRKDGDKTVTHVLNLLDSSLFSSPAYCLQQGDVVYVQPNKYRAATAEINQNRSFWISIASTVLTAASLIITILNYSK